MGKKHINTLKRIELVAEITRKHYEVGRLDRCYKAVWRLWVNPVYPMSYRTYLRYVQTNYKRELREQGCLLEEPSSSLQLKLF